MPFIGGIVMNQCAGVLLQSLFNRLEGEPYLHLYSESIALSPSLVNTEFPELQNASYSPINLSTAGVGPIYNPAVGYGVGPLTFTLAAPSLGNDTIFGWWIYNEGSYQNSGVMWAGPLEPPVVIGPSGLTLTFDTIAMYISDGDTTVPAIGSASFADGGFELPTITPGSFVPSPAWPADTWTGTAGLATAGALPWLPAAVEGSQYAILDSSSSSLMQTVNFPTSSFYVLGVAALGTNSAVGEPVNVSIDGVVQWSITLQSTWSPWYSPEFFLAAGDHTISFTNSYSASLFSLSCLDGVTLSPRP